MEIAILTSSRADFGFYRPLLKLLNIQTEIKFKLVVFGAHLSTQFGLTINEIKAENYKNLTEVNAVPKGDRAIDIAISIADTQFKFAEYWAKNTCDLILCLGDRYEMHAAVSASIPFNIPIAHISGGEETLGAIDNIYRHSLSIMADYHFTTTTKNYEKVKQIKGTSKNVFLTGSLAVDNIYQTKLYDPIEFRELFNFEIDSFFILFTFHPETVNFKKNSEYTSIIHDTLVSLDYNILVTMPNSDTMGGIIRDTLNDAAIKNKKIKLVESLGSRGYYTALKHSSMVLGNSSSGIIEASSFSKYVINIGDRQLGREHGENIIHCRINKKEILKSIELVCQSTRFKPFNIYGSGDASVKIMNELKKIKTQINLL